MAREAVATLDAQDASHREELAAAVGFALDALNKYETTGDDAYLSEARGYLEDTRADERGSLPDPNDMGPETPCEKSPDGKHCDHWYDGGPCHYCGAPEWE
jgi:hypothetical protein